MRKERRWKIEANAFGSLEINNKLEVSGLFERQVRCPRATKDANHKQPRKDPQQNRDASWLTALEADVFTAQLAYEKQLRSIPAPNLG
jgi:hypothetical protein